MWVYRLESGRYIKFYTFYNHSDLQWISAYDVWSCVQITITVFLLRKDFLCWKRAMVFTAVVGWFSRWALSPHLEVVVQPKREAASLTDSSFPKGHWLMPLKKGMSQSVCSGYFLQTVGMTPFTWRITHRQTEEPSQWDCCWHCREC